MVVELISLSLIVGLASTHELGMAKNMQQTCSWLNADSSVLHDATHVASGSAFTGAV